MPALGGSRFCVRPTVVETDSDFYVLLALEREAFLALVKDAYLVATE